MERPDGHERHDGHPHDGNRNGVIRRYLPKRSRIEPSMAADAQAIVDEINNRPMWVRLPLAGRGVRRRTARMNRQTRALHF